MERGFAALHPAVCFVYYIVLILLVMLLPHPLYVALALLGAVTFQLLYDKGRTLGKSKKILIMMTLTVIIINPLLCHRGETILFYLFNQPITLEAMIYGAIMALSLLTVLIIFIAYQQVLHHHKFLYLFASLLPKTSFLIVMAVRFVPLLKRRLKEIAVVQQTKGLDVLEGPLKKRAKDGMEILNILVTWSLENALQTADSMKARGYGLTRRSSFWEYRLKARDRWLLVLISLLTVILLGGRYRGYGSYPIYPALGGLALDSAQLALGGVYLVLNFIPIIIEGKEGLAWQFWKSRI